MGVIERIIRKRDRDQCIATNKKPSRSHSGLKLISQRPAAITSKLYDTETTYTVQTVPGRGRMKARTTGKGIHTCYRLGRRGFYTVLWSDRRTNRSREESSNKYRDPDHLDRDAAGSEGPGAQPHPAQSLGRSGLKLPGAAGIKRPASSSHSRAVRVASRRASLRRRTGNASTRQRSLSVGFLLTGPRSDPTGRVGACSPDYL